MKTDIQIAQEATLKPITEIAAGLGCLAICPNLAGVILTALWALFGNLPFILIQRYNRPRLKKLYDRLAALERRKER